MEIRFHLDEHVDHDIARGLRNRGINVTTITDAGLRSMPDAQHIAFALRDNRVIFTNDPDFIEMSSQHIDHAGITYCAAASRSIGHVVRYLSLMHDCMTLEEMRGRVEYV